MSEKKSSRNPYFSLLGIAWKYAYGQKRRYLQVYTMFLFSNILDALNPVIWGLFINELQKQGTDIIRSAWIYVGVYLVIRFADWCFHGPARVMERKLAFHLSQNFLQELYHKALQLPVKWHQDHHSGAIINRIKKAYDALKNFFQNGFMYLHSFLKFAFALVAVVYFSPLFGAIAVAMGVGIVMIILRFDKPFIKSLDEVNEKEHIVSSTLFDSLSNIISVITLRLESRMEKGLMNKVSAVFKPFSFNVTINEWKWFVVDMCVGLIYATIVIGYIYQNWVPGELFLIGSLVTLIGYVHKFTSVFHDIAWQYTDIVEYDTHVQTANTIIDAYEALNLSEESPVDNQQWDSIEIDELYFSHMEKRNGEEIPQGLYGLKMKIAKGQKIALIGESGSGKSTLLALLRGLYPAERVNINIGMQQFDQLRVISDQVTLFPQEPEIFENTIEYNITLGLQHDKAEIERICEAVYFTEVIEQLPNGLESSIKEKGVNLSGGQKQRLALARGVFASKDSEIVLMDEPTSSVDPKTEVRIYDRLFEEFKDKAVVSSLHRLHLLTKFDYVYILDKGRIVDEGSFEHLRAQSSIFQELWRHQEESLLLS